MTQERWSYSLRVRGPHFARKVSYNAGAATDDYAGQIKAELVFITNPLPTLPLPLPYRRHTKTPRRHSLSRGCRVGSFSEYGRKGAPRSHVESLISKQGAVFSNGKKMI